MLFDPIAFRIEEIMHSLPVQFQDFMYNHPAFFVVGVMFIYNSIRWFFWSGSKKRFSPDHCTNVLITGAAQGLGKLLAE